MRLLGPILANLMVIFAVFGLGNLLRPLFPKILSPVDRLAAILAGGIGMLGILLFLVGMIRFSVAVIWAILVACGLLAGIGLRREGELICTFPTARIPKIPALVIALILVITFIGGLAEPVGDIRMDAIAYHFLGPHVWLRDASVHVLPDECLTAFPASLETIYGALTALGGVRAPNLFAVLSIGLLLLVSYGFAARLGLSSSDAWWAIALIATMPIVYRGAYGGFVDAIFSSFLLLALRFALDARQSSEFALAGIFAGFAMGTKYTGLPAFVLILIAAVALGFVRESAIRPNLLFKLLLLSVTALFVASPWYLRNWLALGSPIYPPPPALLHFFHVKYMSPAAVNALAAAVRREGLGMGHDFVSLLLLPFHLTFHPANFLNGPGGVGIALLALAPFGILSRWRDPFVGALGLFSFLEILGWFVTEQDARFLIHIYILLALFAIWGWRFVATNSPRYGRLLAGAAIACSMLYGLGIIVPDRLPDLHAVISRKFEERRKTDEIPYSESFSYLNANAAVKKVLVLEPRLPTFYLQKNYLKPIGRFGEQTVPEENDFRLLHPKLATYGITHILDVQSENNSFRLAPGQPDLQLVFARDNQRIYRVIGAN
jgi:Dolichyl-phosphate-mannose-protein mannosyltransferase